MSDLRMETEMKSKPEPTDWKGILACVILVSTFLFILGGTIWQSFRDRVSEAQMEQVPFDQELQVKGEACVIVRGEYAMAMEVRGRLVLARYLSDKKRDTTPKECPMNTMFIVLKSQFVTWTKDFEQGIQDRSDAEVLFDHIQHNYSYRHGTGMIENNILGSKDNE